MNDDDAVRFESPDAEEVGRNITEPLTMGSTARLPPSVTWPPIKDFGKPFTFQCYRR